MPNGNDPGSSPTTTFIDGHGSHTVHTAAGHHGGGGGGGHHKKHHGGGGGGGGKKDTINRQKMAAEYGFALAFMNSNHELKHLFNQAVKKSWDTNMFIARLRNTKWFKHHSADVRNAIMQKTSDPATYKANLAKMQANVRDAWGKTYGAGTMNPKQIRRWAETGFRMGWSEAELVDHMSKGINYQKMLTSGHLGGTAAETEGQLEQLVANYGVPLGKVWKAAKTKDIIEGGSTIGGVQDQVREIAKQQYAAFADQFDAGKTTAEIADPYVQKLSELLETNPNAVGLKEKLVQKALTMKDQHGKPAAMNLNDFANTVRGDSRWQYTRNAKEHVADVTGNLLTSFGLLA